VSSAAYALAHPRCGECRMPTNEDALLACPDCRLELCEYCHGEHSCGDDPLSLGQEELIRRQRALDDAATAVESAKAALATAEELLKSATGELRSVGTPEADAVAELLDQAKAPSLQGAGDAIARLREAA
jgi:hypothetical protein